MHNLFLVYFVNRYMFRAYLGPSSGGCYSFQITVFFPVWIVIQSNQDNRQSSNKYQLLYTYSCTSRCWAYVRPKHVDVDEISKNKLCPKLVFLYTIVSLNINKIVWHCKHACLYDLRKLTPCSYTPQ